MRLCFSFEKWLLPVFLGILVSCSEENTKRSVVQDSDDPKIKKLKLPPGFFAERLYSPGENEQGSWVSMTFDHKGRMIASDQHGSLYRLEIPPIGDTNKPKVEKLVVQNQPTDTVPDRITMGYAQGLLYAFNSLYVVVNNHGTKTFPTKSGLFRLQDTDGDDQFDKITLLKAMEGSGEHGPHSIILSPDKNSLYVIAGNHTDVPPMDTYRLPSNWKEDNLFPLIKDPSGHASDRHAPGGWIAHTDSLGQHWELVSAGYRNAFDIAFNDAGDLFAYDADMEYDFGMPWYRPTRIVHATPGSEFGWRTGNSKWSPSYPDNLPALQNIGPGSPTNLVYGGDAAFPEKYRKALFAFDWSFGIIYAIHIEPDGASYKARAEEFISGSPLPLTDGIFGADGALYFLTGGRRLDSDLYRITYTGKKETTSPAATTLTEENRLRRQLETYQEPKEGAVAFVWPYLNHADRHIRYAARIALEHQPVAQWQEKTLTETDPVRLTQAAVALARQGKPQVKDQLLRKLNEVDLKSLNTAQQLDILRAYELVFTRMGTPVKTSWDQTVTHLDNHYPSGDNYVDRQMSKLLITLQAPQAAGKTLALLEAAQDAPTDQEAFMESSDLIFRNPQYGLDIANMLSKVPPAQQTYLATALSAAKAGWTPELQERYFKWFADAFGFRGGRSFVGFINSARKLALNNVPKKQYAYFNTLSGDSLVAAAGNAIMPTGTPPKGPWRNWTMEKALPLTDSLENRNFEQGQNMFAAAMCASCHSMRGKGADIGPDLTQLGTRFSAKDMLEAIIDPNKTVSDQYAATIFYLKDGKSVVGRLMNEEDDKYLISQNPYDRDVLREIPKAEVIDKQLSTVSIMMPGTVNPLNEEELKDLLAFLMAGGNKEHPIYTGKKN